MKKRIVSCLVLIGFVAFLLLLAVQKEAPPGNEEDASKYSGSQIVREYEESNPFLRKNRVKNFFDWFLFREPSSQVYADTVTIPNDGNALDNPYGDTKLPSSYDGLDYYDCYIPYKLTLSDIGGYANRFISGNPAYNATMDSRTMSLYAGQKINKEYDDLSRRPVSNTGTWRGMSVTKDDINMNVYTDNSGNEYYGCALPRFCYNFGGLLTDGGASFPGWSSENRGQLFDVILTDGTCIHFVVRDAKSEYHCNNPSSERAPSGDEAVYGFSDLQYEQYKHLFQAQAGETLEVFCSAVTDFVSKYNLSASGNKAAIIRMYNGRVTNGNAPAPRTEAAGSEVSYSLGDSVRITTPDGNTSMGDSSLSVAGSTLVEEWELLGMPTYQELAKDQMGIKLPTIDDLSPSDAAAVITLKEYMNLMSQANILDSWRVALTAVGIVVVLYGLALLMGILIDKTNNFIDVSVTNILTFGRRRLMLESTKDGIPDGYVSLGGLIFSAGVVITVGFLVLSSTLSTFIGSFIYKYL